MTDANEDTGLAEGLPSDKAAAPSGAAPASTRPGGAEMETERPAAPETRLGTGPGTDAVAVDAAEAAMADADNLQLVMDVELNVTLRFGQRRLSLREVLDLSSGSIIELDRQVDEPVELLLDGKVIARGEAVVIDGFYGLRVTEVPTLDLQPFGRNGDAR